MKSGFWNASFRLAPASLEIFLLAGWISVSQICIYTKEGDTVDQRNSLYQAAKNEYWNSCPSKISGVFLTDFHPDGISFLAVLVQIIISEGMLREVLSSPRRIYTMPLSTVLLRISSILACFKWLIKVFLPEGDTSDCGLQKSGVFFPQATSSSLYFLKDQYVQHLTVTCTTLHEALKKIKCPFSLCLFFQFPPFNNSFHSYCMNKASI